MSMLVYAVVLGFIAGLVHQLIDRKSFNEELLNWVKALVIGGVVAYLLYTKIGYQPIAIFGSAYFGQSILLNLIHRFKPELDHSR